MTDPAIYVRGGWAAATVGRHVSDVRAECLLHYRTAISERAAPDRGRVGTVVAVLSPDGSPPEAEWVDLKTLTFRVEKPDPLRYFPLPYRQMALEAGADLDALGAFVDDVAGAVVAGLLETQWSAERAYHPLLCDDPDRFAATLGVRGADLDGPVERRHLLGLLATQRLRGTAPALERIAHAVLGVQVQARREPEGRQERVGYNPIGALTLSSSTRRETRIALTPEERMDDADRAVLARLAARWLPPHSTIVVDHPNEPVTPERNRQIRIGHTRLSCTHDPDETRDPGAP